MKQSIHAITPLPLVGMTLSLLILGCHVEETAAGDGRSKEPALRKPIDAWVGFYVAAEVRLDRGRKYRQALTIYPDGRIVHTMEFLDGTAEIDDDHCIPATFDARSPTEGQCGYLKYRKEGKTISLVKDNPDRLYLWHSFRKSKGKSKLRIDRQKAMGETDHERIQGTWEVLSVHVDGKEYEHMRGAMYVISRNDIRVVRDENGDKDSGSSLETTSSTYSLNPDAAPKQIDWTTTQEFKTWQPSTLEVDGSGVLDPVIEELMSHRQGIYAFDGDQLRLCFGKAVRKETIDVPEHAKPVCATEFSTKAGDGRSLIILRRRAPPAEEARDGGGEKQLWHDNRITPEQPFPARVIGVIPSWVGYALLLVEIADEKPRYCVAYLWVTQKLKYEVVAGKDAFEAVHDAAKATYLSPGVEVDRFSWSIGVYTIGRRFAEKDFVAEWYPKWLERANQPAEDVDDRSGDLDALSAALQRGEVLADLHQEFQMETTIVHYYPPSLGKHVGGRPTNRMTFFRDATGKYYRVFGPKEIVLIAEPAYWVPQTADAGQSLTR